MEYSPEFVTEMKSLLGKNFDVDHTSRSASMGFPPNSSATFASHVSKDVTADQLVAMRIHAPTRSCERNRPRSSDESWRRRTGGVSYSRYQPRLSSGKCTNLVAKDLSADDLSLSIHGVSPEFVKE